MNPTQTPNEAASKFKQATERFGEEIKKLRTGRAHPSMVEGVSVEVYGSSMPLIQLATIITPEAQLIQITPFDPNNLISIVSAIRDNQTLGLNPSDDGRVVRVQIPPLTEERRRDIAKQLKDKIEDTMVVMRQARHDAREKLDKAKKAKEITEDDLISLQKQIDDLMNNAKADVETLARTKEAEIMTI